ncbi:UbiA family prenyltransferase [Parapedobacter lycopersici]|uniref:UbiA family prenyltransferase n=1 Tax=Parapedobacter lycopersici TaxID=1864939 RepID=UPI00214D4C4E|nr:UbiA family prenyltransferase [Parapedobacter lycopersici]
MTLKIFRELLDLMIFSNVLIACCAVAQGALTYRLLAIPVNNKVLTILGCATLALYNFSMILAKPAHPEASPYRRVRWIFRHERSLWMWTGVALLIAAGLSFQFHSESLLLLLAVGAMGLAYNVPFLQDADGRRFGLRQIPGLKLFYIGLVWAMSCVLLPVAEAHHNGWPMQWLPVMQLMCWVFLFIVAITIPFDIRDIYQDRHYGLKTIPVLLGVRAAHALCGILLAIHTGWVLMSGYTLEVRLALAGVSLLCAGAILLPKKEKGTYYYFFVLDGMLILQFLMIVLFA